MIVDPVRERSIVDKALLVRRAEERLLDLYSEGRLGGTLHTCIGQEFSGAAVCEYLREGDSVLSNHRGHGHFLSLTGNVRGLFAELMGRSGGVSGGSGGSQHLHEGGFFSSGILGGTTPVAAGLALAHKLDARGGLAAVFIGDGALGEGVVYETLNIAARWALPLLVVIEDNGYAQSTAQAETLAGSIEGRAAAFGIPVRRGSSWEWRELAATVEDAVRPLRAGHGPVVVLIETYRLAPHSRGDDLRDPEELGRYRDRDPLNQLLANPSPELAARDLAVRRLVDDAVSFAESSPIPCMERAVDEPSLTWRPVEPDGRRMVEALRQTFATLMTEDPRLVFMGEDVRAPYGGAFKVSASLSEHHPARVLNTPVSEAALVGVGAGLALGGYRAVVEIMFGDFVTLAMDQLVNHCAKLSSAYGRGVRLDMVVRTPMGGRRGYGPTHSQTLDRHVIGVPGLRVVALNSLVDPQPLYSALLCEGAGPTLVIENKSLYARRLAVPPPQGFDAVISGDALPVVHLRPAGTPDVTLVGYGGMLDELIAAADDLFRAHDLIAQVICPTQIYPFAVDPLLDLLEPAPVLVVAEEGQGFAGFGAEFLAQLATLAPERLTRARRVSAAPVPIPASPWLEREVLPGAGRVVAAVLEATDAI